MQSLCSEPRRASNFDKIGEDEEERRVSRQQLAKFEAKEGMFGSLASEIDMMVYIRG